MRSSPVVQSPEFPAAYSVLSTERLRDAFESAPDRFGLALHGLDEDAIRAHPIPGKWSIHEIVFHVTDSETIGTIRFRQALAGDTSPFPGYDQDQWAERLDYACFSAALRRSTLLLFANQREVTGQILARLSPLDWRREGHHAEWGTMTVRQLLELYADHGERHIDQILERRRLLGHPIPLRPLLPERLY